MKKCRVLFIIAAAGFLCFISYRYIMRLFEFFKLVKTLPEYLRNTIGDKPNIDFSFANLNKLVLRVGLKKGIKERETNLKEVIETYIHDFYPELTNAKIEISIYELPDDKEDTKESDEEA